MIWQWLFILIYSTTSAAGVLTEKKNRKRYGIVLTIAAVFLTAVFFALIHVHECASVLGAVVTFRLVLLAGGLLFKNTGCVFVRIVTLCSLDVCLLPLLTVELSWQYLLLGYLIIFCLLCLTPFFSARAESVEWIAGKRSLVKGALAFMPILPVLTSIAVFVVIGKADAEIHFMFFVLQLLFSVSVLLLQEYIAQTQRLKEWNRAMEEWQMGAKQYMNTIRTQRHDFNLHLHAISGLIASGDYEECRAYIKKLVQEANDINELMPVYDSVIGSMLAEMRETARRRGTDIHYDIKYDMKDVLCNAYECNKIIGNLIRNAIDAVETEEEKAVWDFCLDYKASWQYGDCCGKPV